MHKSRDILLRKTNTNLPLLQNVNHFLTYDQIKPLTNTSDNEDTRGFQYDSCGNMLVSSPSSLPAISGLMPQASQSPYNPAISA
jgi:hypothetical protein